MRFELLWFFKINFSDLIPERIIYFENIYCNTMRRSVSYKSIQTGVDTNRKRDDVFWKGVNPKIQMVFYHNESYGEFLRRTPNATKKQRILAIQRFYNNLLK
jgi:hypothetical protein